MKRWLIIIAFVFGVAATLGAALTGAQAAQVESSTVAAQLDARGLCQSTDGHEHKAPVFKPCGKMRNGLAIQCHPCEALMPPVIADSVTMRGGDEEVLPQDFPAAALHGQLFRPPRMI